MQGGYHMNVLGFTKQNSAVGYHRIMLPLHYMKQDGLINGHVRLSDTLNDESFKGHNFDIVIINRMIEGVPVHELLEYKKKYGFKLIIDIDDYWVLDPWHILSDVYPTKEIIEYIKAADFVTVTNELLYAEVKALNQHNVDVVANALPYDEDQFTDIRTQYHKTRFNYVAGSTHEQDIISIKNGLKRLQTDTEFRNNSELIISGFQDHPIWHRMATYYSGGYKNNFRIQNILPIAEYMNLYNDTDVALAPLRDSFFNQCKSNLKVLEAGAKRVPIIASNINPYKSCPHVIKANNPSEWYSQMKRLAKDAIYRKEYGEANANWCREHFHIRKENLKRKHIYEA
jgi:glycosyltransferase involved in cell wall biosynthesis